MGSTISWTGRTVLYEEASSPESNPVSKIPL